MTLNSGDDITLDSCATTFQKLKLSYGRGDILGRMPPAVKRRPIKKGRKTQQTDGEPKYYSRAVAKALEALEILGASRLPLPLSQLTAKLNLTKASVFRLMYTLESTGYVRKDSDGRYSLKQDISRSAREKLIATMLETGVTQIRELTREFRETTAIAALFDNHIEVVAVSESPQTVHMGNTVGRILQPHASSLGKCITAFQADDRREHLIRSYGVTPLTAKTITDENVLHRELEQVRKRGYATDAGETCAEGYCFGAPIYGPEGDVIAAVSMSIPVARLGGQDQQAKIVERLRATASAISAALRS
jgi:IclR family acetate operon transcriptional repressor